MKSNRRTQADRSAATREALVRAGRQLFAEHGYGEVGTEAIAREAGVTRGAMYHQFADKTELFAAVFEQVEAEVTQQIGAVVLASTDTDPIELMRVGARAFMDHCSRPDIQRITLIDAPSVLGWQRWREIGYRYGLGMVQNLLSHAMDVGRIGRQPVIPLAHLLLGMLDEAALYVSRAEVPAQARAEMDEVLDRMLLAL